MSGVRRLLEEDLKLEKKALDIHKSFINEQVDKVSAMDTSFHNCIYQLLEHAP